MKRIFIPLIVSATFTMPAAAANNIDTIGALAQPEFRQLSEDLGSALSYKAITPATPLGITGFDVGVEVTETKLANQAAWDKASTGGAPSKVYVPKIHIHKGLPLGFDIGASYSSVTNTNIKLLGAEVRYAIVEGGVATPALGLRGTYTKLSGVSQLDFNTKGLELVVSKGFTIFTPYAGLGRVWTASTPVNVPVLKEEKFGQSKYFVGGNFNLGVINIAVEGDKTGDATSYGLKLGWRF
jgi:hypothetical protein